MTENIEIRNEMEKASIWVSACRSKFSNRLYIHVGKYHGNETKILPKDYAIIGVKLVEG